jgi:hypothetical protein
MKSQLLETQNFVFLLRLLRYIPEVTFVICLVFLNVIGYSLLNANLLRS